MFRRFLLALALVLCVSPAFARGGGNWTAWARRPWNPGDLTGLLMRVRADSGITLAATPLASGTAPPVVTFTGTLTQPLGLCLQIDSVAGGTARGQATFKWGTDSCSTFPQTGVLTAATVVLGTTAVTTNFPTGTYGTDQVWKAAVAQWSDQSVNARHFKATDQGVAGASGAANDARAPVFTASHASFGLRPAITWPVGNTLPMLNTDTFTAISGPITYVFVCRMTNQANGKNLLNVANDTTQANIRGFVSAGGATTMNIGSGTTVSGISATVTSPVILVATLHTASGALTLNGVSKGTGNPNTNTAIAWRFGRAGSGSTTSSLEGDIAEAFAIDHIPTTQELNAINAYAGATYGQTVTLN